MLITQSLPKEGCNCDVCCHQYDHDKLLRHGFLNLITFKPWLARARKVIDMIVTNSSVETRIYGAIVDVDLAILAIESAGTLAVVVVDEIRAFSSLLTGILLALVDVNVAILALEPGKAVALEVIDQINAAWRWRVWGFLEFLKFCSDS